MDIYLIIITVLFIYMCLCLILDLRERRTGKPKTSESTPPPKARTLPGKMRFKKCTIKMIIRWEQLMKKPFSQIDYTDKEDVDALLYVMNMDGMKDMYTYSVFKTAISNDKIFKELISGIERMSIVSSQFQKALDSSGGTVASESCFVGEIVAMLIMDGLDAHYAMEEMEIYDLPLYIEADNRKRREFLESERLWTYMTILPHIDGKKLRSAQDMYPFPWEIQEMKDKAEAEIKANEEDFRKFMAGELFDINKVNWSKSN
ncbi:hypothetical protein ACMSEG_24965 [Bacteroides faecis]|jgi:hypothetical protein|uniref:hypothetical protein n=3 Tax=Bacteroides faecis TaxID=674529 RepID=UPI0011C145B3|nr:hypothetical protein [Bacteroides faecis]